MLTSVVMPKPNTSIRKAVPSRRKAEADGIAHQLERFADRVGEQPPQAEELLRGAATAGAAPGKLRRHVPASSAPIGRLPSASSR